jgi:hypothetical protein
MKVFVFLGWMAMLPASVLAQAAIAGVVHDSTGAPMPGVIVTATSPALIEKTRRATTNSAGLYRIDDCRPGTYTVTFTAPGYRPYQRDGVELTGSATATVHAELTLGELNEAITVTAVAPAVDSHTSKREVTLSGDVVRSIPTIRTYNALLVLIPGVVTSTSDVVTGTVTTSFPIHGGRANEGRVLVNGLNIGSPPAGNSAASYVVDLGHAEEVTFVTAGALGESETGGLVMNIVPRSGGNTMRGSVFASGTGAKFHSNNVTPALKARGVTAATPLTRTYDVTGSLGGAIRKDRAWFFASAHTGGSTRHVADVFYNLNAGDPSRWLYAPDFNRRAYSDRTFENASGRVTWQMTPRNRVSAFWDAQTLCRRCTGATAGNSEPARVSPEAVGVLGRPLHVSQATWSSTVTSRLLIEAGYGGTFFGVGNFERRPNKTRDLIRVVEQCASGCADNGNIPGLAYRSQDFSVAHTGSYSWNGAVSYVTGTHSVKIGAQHTLMTDDRTWMTNTQNLTYRVSNGVPNQLTQSISPWVNNARAAWQSLFAQEQWTYHRLTLQGAVRFDRAWSWFPAQQEGPSRFLPSPIMVPETRGVDSYKDITPRMGAAYDAFGNGRTALKMSLGKYLESVGIYGNYANTNPTLRMPQTTMVFGTAGVTRAWTDENRNFVPDCDLSKSGAQDLRAVGGDLCGALSNTSFGRDVLTNAFDAGILDGWGVRPSDWNISASVQQQIGARSSVDVTFIRRSYRGFFVVDNLALGSSDLTPYRLVAPLDARLPGGGGYVVPGLFDVVPDKTGQVANLITSSDEYGKWSQAFSGLDVTVNARIGPNLMLFGGTSTGQTVADNCAVRARLPELATTTTGTSPFGAGLLGSAVTPISPYCRVASGVLTQFRGLSSYRVPKVDVQVSATFQSKPGAMLAANYAAPDAAVAPSLGRSLSGNAPNVTVNLVAPGTMYGDRINQLDLRVAKILKFGGARSVVAVELYNAVNSSAVLSYNTAFVPNGPWLQPLSILTPRFFKLTAEIDF